MLEYNHVLKRVLLHEATKRNGQVFRTTLGPADLTFYIRPIFGLLFVIIGLRVVKRAVEVFGMDYMGLVYLYYPEDSEIQDNEIYSSICHPAYHGIIMVTTGLFFIYFSVYQLVDLVLIITIFHIHIHFVEEKELIARFGDGYKKYQASVPALFPKYLKPYLRFIFGKSK